MKKVDIRKTAYELFLQGYSLRQIQTILNKVGIKAHFSTIKYWIDKEVQLYKKKRIQIPKELRKKIK